MRNFRPSRSRRTQKDAQLASFASLGVPTPEEVEAEEDAAPRPSRKVALLRGVVSEGMNRHEPQLGTGIASSAAAANNNNDNNNELKFTSAVPKARRNVQPEAPLRPRVRGGGKRADVRKRSSGPAVRRRSKSPKKKRAQKKMAKKKAANKKGGGGAGASRQRSKSPQPHQRRRKAAEKQADAFSLQSSRSREKSAAIAAAKPSLVGGLFGRMFGRKSKSNHGSGGGDSPIEDDAKPTEKTIEDEGWTLRPDKKTGSNFYWNATLRKSQWFHPWLKQGALVRLPHIGSVGMVVSGIYEIPPGAQEPDVTNGNPAHNNNSKHKPKFVVDVAVEDTTGVALAGYRIYDKVGVLKSPHHPPLEVLKPARSFLPRLRESIALGWATKFGIKGMRLIGAEFDAEFEDHDRTTFTGRVTAFNSSTGKYTAKFADGDVIEYSLAEIYAGKPRLPPKAQSALPSLRQKTRFAPAGAVVADCPSAHGLKGFIVPAGSPFSCDVCHTGCFAGSAMFGCRSCDYDLCTECHATPLVMNCRGRHGLVTYDPDDSPDLSFCCDLCLSTIENTVSHRCATCDFDVCQVCYYAPKIATCSGSHTLGAFRTPVKLSALSYFCDRCDMQVTEPNAIMYGCRLCDYDLCAGCYVSSSARANPEKVRVSRIIERCFLAYGDRPCLGYEVASSSSSSPSPSSSSSSPSSSSSSSSSQWRWLSYSSIFNTMRKIVALLQSYKIPPRSYIGMSGDNSVGYFCVYFALLKGGFRPVPLSLHLSPKHASNIVQEAQLAAVFVAAGSTASKFGKVVSSAKRDAAAINYAGGSSSSSSSSSNSNVATNVTSRPVAVPFIFECLHLAPERLDMFFENNTRSSVSAATGAAPVSAWAGGASPELLENPLLILYTSGSTGAPKGAIMSERSFLNEIRDMITLGEWDSSDVSLIDSPMATSATPYNIMGTLLNGGRMSIYKDLVRVFDVCAMVGPTSLGMVPQMFAVLYKSYQSRLDQGETEQALKREYRHCRLGWRVGALNCGGATPMPRVQRWLKSVFEDTLCQVTENYASTEAGPITSSWGEHGSNTNGVVSDGVDVKLVDWGEYRLSDTPYPRGEICVKSPCMTSGYLNRPDLTKTAFDDDGYYRTGDIGELVDKGPPKRIKVVDRCKNMFKLVNGEWVSPENVEAELMAKCSLLRQIMVFGSSRHARVVAIVVPAFGTGEVVVLEEAERKTAILSQLQACYTGGDESKGEGSGEMSHGNSAHLRHFEIPIDISLSNMLFTAENGMMTQTNKLCRPAIRKKFAKELETMLQTQQEALEEDELAQRYTIVRILRKYAHQQQQQPKRAVVVEKADLVEWEGLEWNSISATSTHSIIRLSFPGKASALDPGWLWNNNLGRSIAECVDMINTGDTLAPVDWKTECTVDLGPLLGKSLLGKEDAPQAAGIVLMTGATGFLGSGLLAKLCEASSARQGDGGLEIWCVVRVGSSVTNTVGGGSNDDTGAAVAAGGGEGEGEREREMADYFDADADDRLKRSLESREQMTPALRQALDDGTVRAVKGDLGLRHLGMESGSLFRHVASRVRCIVHCGCHVNHLFDYATLKPTNVGSVDSLAEMCALAPKDAKPDFIYVSTISVLEDHAMAAEGEGSVKYISSQDAGGYSQSKWVAEMRLRNYNDSASDGALFGSLTLVRPGIIGFDSRSGSANRSDWFLRFLIGALQLGAVKLCDAPQSINVTPVDHAAVILLNIMQERCRVFRKEGTEVEEDEDAADVTTLHLPITASVSTHEFMQQFIASAGEQGRHIRAVGAEEWAELLQSLPSGNAFSSFNDGRFDDGLDGIESHPSGNTVCWLLRRGVHVVEGLEMCYSKEQIDGLVSFLLRREPLLKRRLMLRTLSNSI